MRSLKEKSIILICCIGVFTLLSCKKNNPGETDVLNILSQEDWRISLYQDNGRNETYLFTDYVFTFRNGTVTAVRNGTTVTGTYSLAVDDGRNKLFLNFGETEPFEELTDDWRINEETSAKVNLGDGKDQLIFEKN